MVPQVLCVLSGCAMWEILFKALPKPSGKHDARPKLISALHAALVVQGVVANLLYPDQSLIQDPMFASSKTLTCFQRPRPWG